MADNLNGVNVVAVARAPRDAGEAVRFAAAIEPVTIGTWKLENTDESLPDSAQPIIKAPATAAETVFGEDNRTLVPDEHLAPEGKYRCKSSS
jgi:hypothetical protein